MSAPHDPQNAKGQVPWGGPAPGTRIIMFHHSSSKPTNWERPMQDLSRGLQAEEPRSFNPKYACRREGQRTPQQMPRKQPRSGEGRESEGQTGIRGYTCGFTQSACHPQVPFEVGLAGGASQPCATPQGTCSQRPPCPLHRATKMPRALRPTVGNPQASADLQSPGYTGQAHRAAPKGAGWNQQPEGEGPAAQGRRRAVKAWH